MNAVSVAPKGMGVQTVKIGVWNLSLCWQCHSPSCRPLTGTIPVERKNVWTLWMGDWWPERSSETILAASGLVDSAVVAFTFWRTHGQHYGEWIQDLAHYILEINLSVATNNCTSRNSLITTLAIETDGGYILGVSLVDLLPLLLGIMNALEVWHQQLVLLLQRLGPAHCFIAFRLQILDLVLWKYSGTSNIRPFSLRKTFLNSRSQVTVSYTGSRLGFLYIRANVKAKAIIFFDLLPLTHRCSINTQETMQQIRKRRHFRFRSNINAPLQIFWLKK